MKLIPKRKVVPTEFKDFTDIASIISNIVNNITNNTNITGVEKLSQLGIDTNKSWVGRSITNLGSLDVHDQIDMNINKIVNLAAPVADNDAARKVDIPTITTTTVSVSQPARAFSTTYQNTSGKIRMVVAEITCSVTADIGDTFQLGSSNAFALIGASSPPTTEVDNIGINLDIAGLDNVNDHSSAIDGNLCFIVPVNYYYRINTSVTGDGDTPLLLGSEFTEYDLF